MKIKRALKPGMPATMALLILTGMVACRVVPKVPEAGSGTFRFWTAAAETLAVDRDPLLDRIEVEGHGPRGAQFMIAAREAQCGVPDLQAGHWRIEARALHCQEAVAATGQTEVDIGAGSGAG